jgi:hypothetical protein
MDVRPAYLRLKDAAIHCGMSPQMLQKLHGTKEGPPRIKKGRCVLFAIRDLDAWMERDRQEAA